MAKIAVASTDGLSINEHFGRAEMFLIYEVDAQGGYQFLERREVGSGVTERSVIAAAELLRDVELVLAARLGPRAEQALRERGILGLPVTGSIEKALIAYAKRGKFIRNSIKSPAGNCQFRAGFRSCGGCKTE